jgi:predicted metalloprotease
MKFDDQRVDTSGVDDLRGRRGGRAGLAVGGGAGVLAFLVVVLVNALGGGALPPGAFDLSQLDPGVLGSQAGTVAASDLAERCATEGAIDTYDDCFMAKVYNEADEVWSVTLADEGYRPPRLAFFDGFVSTACGGASAEVGPFYCPADERMYFDLGFLHQLQQEFGAEGRYAQAYVLAHEYGHHVQTVLGIEPQVRRLQRQNPGRANQLSVSLELQADCLAGVWGRLAGDLGNLTVTDQELQQAQEAAAAVGDDRIQRQTQGRVDPETWTHGSAEQRRSWYLTGYRAGDPGACDTFS